jgi:hypothetical protein
VRARPTALAPPWDAMHAARARHPTPLALPHGRVPGPAGELLLLPQSSGPVRQRWTFLRVGCQSNQLAQCRCAAPALLQRARLQFRRAHRAVPPRRWEQAQWAPSRICRCAGVPWLASAPRRRCTRLAAALAYTSAAGSTQVQARRQRQVAGPGGRCSLRTRPTACLSRADLAAQSARCGAPRRTSFPSARDSMPAARVDQSTMSMLQYQRLGGMSCLRCLLRLCCRKVETPTPPQVGCGAGSLPLSGERGPRQSSNSSAQHLYS